MSWRDTGVRHHRRGGISYFRLSTGFSLNEGQFPNIHVHWARPMGFYIALTHRLKWWWYA